VQNYLDEVAYQLHRAEKTGKELGVDNPLWKSKLNYFVAHAHLQMGQVRRRVLNNEVILHDEKVFSVFQPHTEWISKGKAALTCPVSLNRRSRAACMFSQRVHPYGRTTIQPRTGE
jgi:hypothetical protein